MNFLLYLDFLYGLWKLIRMLLLSVVTYLIIWVYHHIKQKKKSMWNFQCLWSVVTHLIIWVYHNIKQKKSPWNFWCLWTYNRKYLHQSWQDKVLSKGNYNFKVIISSRWAISLHLDHVTWYPTHINCNLDIDNHPFVGVS